MLDFDCDFCVRVGLSQFTPKADNQGVELSNSEIRERYNERRYQHYLDDFGNDEIALARHLNARTNHFIETASEDDRTTIKNSSFAANASTLAWWKRARTRDAELAEQAMRRDYEPLLDEIWEWMNIPPAARFAQLKKQIQETFKDKDISQILTAADNAQQLPTEKELTPAQQQSLIEERDRQLVALEELP